MEHVIHVPGTVHRISFNAQEQAHEVTINNYYFTDETAKNKRD